jgi:hypothetical protein
MALGTMGKIKSTKRDDSVPRRSKTNSSSDEIKERQNISNSIEETKEKLKPCLKTMQKYTIKNMLLNNGTFNDNIKKFYKIYAKIKNIEKPINYNYIYEKDYNNYSEIKQYDGYMYGDRNLDELGSIGYYEKFIPLLFILYRKTDDCLDYSNVYKSYNNLVEHEGKLYSPDFTVDPDNLIGSVKYSTSAIFGNKIVIDYVLYDPRLDPYPEATILAAQNVGIKIPPETLDTWNRIIDEQKQTQEEESPQEQAIPPITAGSRKKSFKKSSKKSKKGKKSSKKSKKGKKSSKKSTKRRK